MGQPFTAPKVRPDDETLLDDEGQRERRNDHHHRERAHAAPVDGELGGVVEQADRQRLRVDRAGQLRGEREFVPGRHEGEDRRRGDAGAGERKLDLPEGLPARAAVDLRGLREIARHLPEEAVDQPDGEGHVERDIGEDQREMRVDDAEAREDDEERQRERDAGHRARQHEAEEQRRLAAEAEAGEGVAARHADRDGDRPSR